MIATDRNVSATERARFEVRRLHNLLLFVEHARSPRERVAAGGYVFCSLRRYLAEFHGVGGVR